MSRTPALRSHPTEEDLSAYLELSASQEQRSRIEDHLREGCLLCMFALRDRLETADGRLPKPSTGGTAHLLETIESHVDRAERKTLLIEVETKVAPHLVSELMLRPTAGRREVVRGSRRYKLLGLAEILRQQSRLEARRDVARAIELAELSVEVADCLSTDFYGARLVADARALAWAVVGNSQRVAGEFFAAERAFQTASDLLERGTGNPTEVAEVQTLLASLRIEQARFRDAIRLLQEAAGTYRSVGLSEKEGMAIFKMGRAAILAGEPERALELFESSIDLLDVEGNDKLVLFAHHNIAFALQDAGAFEDARQYFEQIAPIYDRFPEDRSAQLQRRWLEGLILAGLGDTDAAVGHLSQIRQVLIDEERAYDTAQVTLDLAGVLLAAGQTAEVKRLVREMYPVFRSQDVHRQAIAALVLFEQAVTTEAATVSLARDVGRYLARARNNPYLRFEPAGSRAD